MARTAGRISEPVPLEQELRRRTEVVFLTFIGALLLLAGRLVYLQGFRAGDFLEQARRFQERTFELPARRGAILDRSGAEMAIDIPLKSVAIDPSRVHDPELVARRIGEILGLPQDEVSTLRGRLERLSGATVKRKVEGEDVDVRVRYCLVKRDVDRRAAERLLEEAERDPHLKGRMWVDDTPRRFYPGGRDASQILGTVMTSGQGRLRSGADGIERRFDRHLAGKPGVITARVNALEKPIPETAREVRSPVDGQNVQLTIDRDIQHFVEEELERTAAERKPDSITAVVMEVATGNILAMANWPTFHPEDRPHVDDPRTNPCRNRAVSDLFEPGSIFKVFTAAAALETGIQTNAFCRNSWPVSNRVVHCAHGARHGQVNLARMVEQSCNIAAGHYAQRIGRERLYAILDRFGFQSYTGIPFPAEACAKMLPPDQWRPIRTINVGFGQGIAVTPLQILTAYNAIANDGVYISPQLVATPDPQPQVTRRVMSSEHAADLRRMMEAVVVTGTGKSAKIPGYSVAGKTGTAQMSDGRRYIDGYVASFAGIVPARKPRLTILVSVTHPRVGQYGGVVAGPAFREIARRSVDFLKIRPDQPDDRRDGVDPGSFIRHARAQAQASQGDD